MEAPLISGAPASSRPYGGETDLALMRNLLSRATSASPPQYYSHPGDMLWLLYRDPGYDPRTEVRLWEDRGIVGGS